MGPSGTGESSGKSVGSLLAATAAPSADRAGARVHPCGSGPATESVSSTSSLLHEAEQPESIARLGNDRSLCAQAGESAESRVRKVRWFLETNFERLLAAADSCLRGRIRPVLLTPEDLLQEMCVVMLSRAADWRGVEAQIADFFIGVLVDERPEPDVEADLRAQVPGGKGFGLTAMQLGRAHDQRCCKGWEQG